MEQDKAIAMTGHQQDEDKDNKNVYFVHVSWEDRYCNRQMGKMAESAPCVGFQIMLS